ncbi:uncharacterized protein ACMZJ9_014399 [Mantella aurantiaca]
MATSATMDVDWGHVTEQMLNLTLEIIYLLTREDYILVKTTGLYVISRNHPPGHAMFGMTQSSMAEPPPSSLISEKKNKQTILEAIQKMIGLLTGEVPIRCQDVTVYFSMEEWEYIEGHKDLYKDVMMEKRPPLTSPDGSNNRNPPERCPRPLYSQDSTQQDQVDGSSNRNPPERCPRPLYSRDSTQQDQVDGSSNRNPPERCPHPLYSRDSTQVHQEIPQEDQVDGSSNRNPPERCPRPLCSQDSTQEHQEIPQEDQGESVITIKAEVYNDEEDPYVMGDDQCKEEEIPPEISTDGSKNRIPPERCPRPLYSRDSTQDHQEIPQEDQFGDVEEEVYMTAYQQCKEEECPIEINAAEIHEDGRGTLTGHLAFWDGEYDNLTEVSPREDQATPPVLLYPGLNRFPTPSNLQGSSSDKLLNNNNNVDFHGADWPSSPANAEELAYHKALRGNKLHLCPFCGKQFTTHANVVRHVRTHTGDRPYSCSLCGKSFTQKSILLNHQKVHTGDRPFPCPDCGKCFAKSSDVIRHRRVHTGERPYLCLECGKSFTQKFRLRNHQRFHNEEKLPLWGLASKSNQFR